MATYKGGTKKFRRYVTMAVITISRQFGAGGRTLAKMVADKLDCRFLDDLIIQEISQKAKVSEDWVKSMERSAGGKLAKFIAGLLSRDYMERIIGDDKGYMDEKIYVEVLHDVITQFAEQGDVVFMGRGGQYILNKFNGAYHILLVAEKADRVKFMQKHYKMTAAQAEQAVMRGEKMRMNLYRKFGKEDYNQPHLYHLILNMSKLTLDKALLQICSLVEE